MTPEKAIDTLETLLGDFNRRAHGLRTESDEIAEAWDGLSRVGGQRADHAALLLGRLRPHLREIVAFCTRCEQQIDGLVADPFGTKS